MAIATLVFPDTDNPPAGNARLDFDGQVRIINFDGFDSVSFDTFFIDIILKIDFLGFSSFESGLALFVDVKTLPFIDYSKGFKASVFGRDYYPQPFSTNENFAIGDWAVHYGIKQGLRWKTPGQPLPGQ